MFPWDAFQPTKKRELTREKVFKIRSSSTLQIAIEYSCDKLLTTVK